MPEQHNPILIAYRPGQPRTELVQSVFDEAFPVTVHTGTGDTEQGQAYWVLPGDLDYALMDAECEFSSDTELILLDNQRQATYPEYQYRKGRRFVNDCTGHEFKE